MPPHAVRTANPAAELPLSLPCAAAQPQKQAPSLLGEPLRWNSTAKRLNVSTDCTILLDCTETTPSFHERPRRSDRFPSPEGRQGSSSTEVPFVPASPTPQHWSLCTLTTCCLRDLSLINITDFKSEIQKSTFNAHFLSVFFTDEHPWVFPYVQL